MSDITPFIFPTTGQTVRTVVVDGEPWFVVSDVANVLELGNVHSSLALLDQDEKGLHSMETPGGQQRYVTVNEPGLWSLILRSRKPEAKAFKRWVTHDVLPAIRKTGSYSLPMLAPDELELAQHNVRLILEKREAENRALAAEHELLELAPAAHAWDTLASADGDYSVREAGYILNRDPAIKTGERRLFDLLRTWRLVDWRDIPYANHAQHVRLRPRSFTNRATGEEMPAKPQVRVTAAGIRYLHKRLGGTANVADLLAEPVPA